MPTLPMQQLVTNPFDGSEVAQVPLMDAAALDAAIGAAHAAFEQTRRMPPFERSQILSHTAGALRRRRDEFAQTIVAEAGKPITFAEAEVDRAINTLTAAAEEARHGAQGEWQDLDAFAPGRGHVGLVKRFPIGVIYGIAPFNFPLNLVLHKVAPAIASGNTIVVKPSPRTPLSAMKLAEILRESGCLDGQVNVVVCPNDLAQRPIDDVRVRHVSFTGSDKVGWQVKQRAWAKRCTLELGGNAAVIVHDDADLDATIGPIALGAFGYAGQSCISVQRIFVQQAVYGRFREMMLLFIRDKVRVGDPRDRATVVGPMIDPDAQARVLSRIGEAERDGAKVLCGAQLQGPCITPALIENVDPKSPICQTEIFGPVATFHPYTSFDEALAMANDTPYGLQAGVFTRGISRAWQAFESLEVGGVMINQVPTWRVETMPYGGVKQSGFGREGIRYAMQEMTEPRVMVMQMH